MTSYVIEVGYNSYHNRDEVGEEIQAAFKDLQENPKRILEELKKTDEALLITSPEMVDDCIASYAEPIKDLTATIELSEAGKFRSLSQCASGGGEARAVKEAIRRAVCRLIMYHCHSRGMEISINVY